MGGDGRIRDSVVEGVWESVVRGMGGMGGRIEKGWEGGVGEMGGEVCMEGGWEIKENWEKGLGGRVL